MSDSSLILSAKNLAKDFYRGRNPMYYLSRDTFFESWFDPPESSTHTALNDVSFDIKAGESLGIIGRNGAGKSTLLSLLAGIKKPTRGTIQVKGRVGSILSLGGGFHPDFSGTENIFFVLSILGVSQTEAKSLYPEILEFSELGDAIDDPVATYSSGMVLRLAFSIQITLKPDILLLDEIFGVGDIFFRQKCSERLTRMREEGTALILTTHDPSLIRDFCDKGLLLFKGNMLQFGNPALTQNYYHRLRGAETLEDARNVIRMINNSAHESETIKKAIWMRSSTRNTTEIRSILVVNEAGQHTTKLKVGEAMRVLASISSPSEKKFHTTIMLQNHTGLLVHSSSTHTRKLPMFQVGANQQIEIAITLELNISPGEYTILIACTHAVDGIGHMIDLDSTPWIGPISVHNPENHYRFNGLFDLKSSFSRHQESPPS